ncbi:MAG: hypothetical protein ACR2FV_04220 [Ornithinimicrobium sp.]|uniref:hypothetical protein n=1 Tax=Ornithinimicrobium sp. TaxID=1977084 RepID=UPI003D9BD526
MSQTAPAARTALRALTWARSDRMTREELLELIAAAGPALLPPVNTAIASPRGFRRTTPTRTISSVGNAQPSTDGREHQSAPTPHAGMPYIGLDRLLGADAVQGLRPAPGVTVDERSWTTPWQVATAVAALCCAGVPVLTAVLPATVRSMLDPGLLAAGDLLDDVDVRDPDRREARSIGLRRSAHRAYGYHPAHDPPRPAISVLADQATLTEALRHQLAAQSWSQVHLHVLGDDDISLLREVQATGSVYLTRLRAGVSYGPHHLEDLVHALWHSGCGVACSPRRFAHEPEHGAVVERPATPTEVTSPTSEGLAGTALWYAGHGLTPPDGPAYLGHGCNAVLTDAQPADWAPTSIVHRRTPPQLAWFHAESGHSTLTAANSYFARAGSRARS